MKVPQSEQWRNAILAEVARRLKETSEENVFLRYLMLKRIIRRFETNERETDEK
jgi:adenine C2-methylase RlmN of 23S rRNA A2503 and tRNA A37